jgi:sialidase-1
MGETKPFFEMIDVFLPGDGFGVRLPGLFVTREGTVIATCQKRKGDLEDTGHDTDILVQRSLDDGGTWVGQEVVFTEPGVNTYLGPIFEDLETATLFIGFWKLPREEMDEMVALRNLGQAGGGFWLIKSNDQGATWSEPRAFTPLPNRDGWVGTTGNSVHGIQLAGGPCGGRLIIPGWLYNEKEMAADTNEFHEPTNIPVSAICGGLLYSDDHGDTWQVGEVLPPGSSEVTLVETEDGSIYVNYRRSTEPYYNGLRRYARSTDGGESFCEHGQVPEQITPGCHAGLTRYPAEYPDNPDILLFSNPAWFYYRQPPWWNRIRLTIRASYDDGRNWLDPKLVIEGHAGYSDLAVTHDKTILCICETELGWPEEKLDGWYNSLDSNRKRRPWCEGIRVARFNLEWMVGNDK